MGQDTYIEWAHHTFNPWVGCYKESPGCKNCYAEEMMDHRFGKAKWGVETPRPVTSDANWKQPKKWNRLAIEAGERHRVFCASVADVFEDRDDLVMARHRLMDLIYLTPQLDWLLLTKRPDIAYYWSAKWPLHKNVWIGTSVENQATALQRVPWLLRTKATKRFLSVEPLLGPVSVMMALNSMDAGTIAGREWSDYLQWVIVGGESGRNSRPMKSQWVRHIRDECKTMHIPFFFKQWGEYGPEETYPGAMYPIGKKLAGRKLDGIEHNEVPDGLFAKETVSTGVAGLRGSSSRSQETSAAPTWDDEQTGSGILEPPGNTSVGW